MKRYFEFKGIFPSPLARVGVGLLLLLYLLSGCQEVGPTIDLSNGNRNALADTSYIESPVQTPEVKNVFVEDFTGIQCANCPLAQTQLENLRTANAGRVIGISYHTSFLDNPLPESKQLLTTTTANGVQTYLGDPGYKPNGAVDRVLQTSVVPAAICDDYTNWTTYVNTALSNTTPVNINITHPYNASTRELTIIVELHYTSAQADSNKLGIYLSEDSIITAQELPSTAIDTNYIHQGVFRVAVTNILGDKINYNLTAGTVVRKTYKVTLPATPWKPEHMHIVAFVHRYQNGNKNILQTKTSTVL